MQFVYAALIDGKVGMGSFSTWSWAQCGIDDGGLLGYCWDIVGVGDGNSAIMQCLFIFYNVYSLSWF